MGQAWIDPGAEAKYGYVLPFIAVKTAGSVQFAMCPNGRQSHGRLVDLS